MKKKMYICVNKPSYSLQTNALRFSDYILRRDKSDGLSDAGIGGTGDQSYMRSSHGVSRDTA